MQVDIRMGEWVGINNHNILIFMNRVLMYICTPGD